MSPNLARIAFVTLTIAACSPAIARAEGGVVSWLDEPTPASWNTPGASIPAAPKLEGPIDARCREQARPAQLEEDTRIVEQGWDLVGAYQGGWGIVVVRATAGYDGMCRPRQYQDFVFVRGVFAGTLAPQPMESRTDGALGRVWLAKDRLTAEYQRYAASDPLCCPSRATTVVFEIAAGDRPVVQPVSATTQPHDGSPGAGAGAAGRRPLEGTYWRVVELAGKSTPEQHSPREAHLQFQPDGRVSGSDGCNRITGTYELDGDRVTFGEMIATQMACMDSGGTEAPFRDALKSASRFTIAGDRLELFDAAGTRLAAFAANPDVPGTPSAPASPPPASSAPESELAGTAWRLVRFEGGDGTVLTPDDPAKYTIEFAADGKLAARVDCNRGRGTWESSGPSHISLGPLALTRAMCPPGSLHDQIVRQWGNIRSYVMGDGHLFLALMADGGIYEYEPIPTPE